jgi:large subunit ribosomal protein L7/L12
MSDKDTSKGADASAEEKKEEAPVTADATADKKEATPKAEEKVEEKKPAEADAKADKEEAQTEETEEVEVPEKFKKLVEEVENMSVLELHELVKVLEKKFGVSAAAVAVAAPGAGATEGGEDEKSSFTVELTAAGDQKIAVIKVVKEVLGLGLKEAKEMVDGVPSPLKENVAKEEAEEIKAKIEEAGGKVELK